MYGGAVETDRIKLPYEWLEFRSWGVRLRGRGLPARVVPVREVRYDEISELALLIATRGRRWRGVRVRTAGGSGCLYFFAKPAVLTLLARQFDVHGIAVKGQVTRSRLPYANAFIYPEAVLEPLPEA